MIYHFTISTPANTQEADKNKTVLKLERGIIHQIDIIIPPGHAALANLAINRAIHQVWPSNNQNYFKGDDTTISMKEHYPILKEPYQLEAYTWNIDDTYSHSFYIRIGLLAEKHILRRLF